jgi:hypothetical protein
MPKKRMSDIVKNPAASALGVGPDPDRWTLTAVVIRLERQYTGLVKHATNETEVGRGNRARLFWAQASVLAEFLASYYQDNSRDPEDYQRWSHRTARAQSLAFRTTNQIAENLHAGLDVGEEPV